jgi:hypothetical protein
MDQLGDRRYRLNESEVEPVMGLVRCRLLELVEYREGLGEAELLFRVLYRFETYRVGRPMYPDPVTWETIQNWVEENGPIQIPVSECLSECRGKQDQQ